MKTLKSTFGLILTLLLLLLPLNITAMETDNDVIEEQSNVLIEEFVSRFYTHLLGRQFDSGGLNYWSRQIGNGILTAADLAEQFVFSKEMELQNLSHSEFVARLYETFMGRQGDWKGRGYWQYSLDMGVTKRSVVKEFLDSKEFSMICRNYGITAGTLALPNASDVYTNLTMYVYYCYDRVLDRKPDSEALEYWVQMLNQRRCRPEEIIKTLLDSPEYLMRYPSNADYVETLYWALHMTAPNENGVYFWAGSLEWAMSRDELFNEFLQSGEFQQVLRIYSLT